MELKKFDPSTSLQHRVWLIIGPRSTGKTTLLKDLLYHTHKRYNNPFSACATKESFEMMQDIFPPQMIYGDGYNFEAADNYVELCVKYCNLDKSNIMVLDDCMYSAKVMKTETQKKIHMNGRHYNITLFNCAQYIMSLPPDIRSNIDYVFCLKDLTQSNQRKLYEYFFGMFSSFKEFSTIFDHVTNDFGVLVLDRTQAYKGKSECLRWYKAKRNLPDFRIGDDFYFQSTQNQKQVKFENFSIKNVDDDDATEEEENLKFFKAD